MQKPPGEARSILLLVGAACGAIFACSAAAIVIAARIVDQARPVETQLGNSPLDTALLVTVLLVIGAAFLPSLYYSVLRLMGRPVPPASPAQLKLWQGALLVIIWAGAAFAAGWLSDKPVIKYLSPLLYVLAITSPAYFFARLATGGLHLGSRQRVWGALAAGIGLGITPAILIELLLVLTGFVIAGVYIAMHPELQPGFLQLADKLKTSNDLDQVIGLIGPSLRNPLAVVIALIFFSGFSPLIEETAKSLATWSVFDRLTSPAQGFAIGALSGTAFGLIESLLISASPNSSWTTTLLVRGASTMMHIMAASLTGWGIGQFRLNHNLWRLLTMYLAAMSLHGLWNAAVVAITFGGLQMAVHSQGVPSAVLQVAAGGGVLVLLCILIPIGMGFLNWRFRATARAAANSAGGATQSTAEEPAL